MPSASHVSFEPRTESQTLPATTADGILQLGLGFWASRTLLSAVDLQLFTLLARGPMTGEAIARHANLHARSARDFLDALVALKMLNRNGEVYSNTPEADRFLDREKPTYVGGLLEMASTRLYDSWGHLTDALRNGKLVGGVNAATDGTFDTFYSDPDRLKTFLKAMTGLSLPVAEALAGKFPWQDYRTFYDVGCAQGAVPVTLAQAHGHLTGGGWDLPPVRPIFEDYVRTFGLDGRLAFRVGDFFKDALPQADVLIMGHILHDWDLPTKRMLLKKAYDALPAGGALIVYEALIDDDRKANAFGLLMSLNMLIETSGGFDYTGADCSGWMREAGFRQTRVEHLLGPDSMVIGIK
jgi:hypothetical protein